MDAAPDVTHRFRWYHTLLAILGGFASATFLGAILVVAFYGTDLDEIPLEANFWILLPTQMLGYLAVLVWISRSAGSGSFERDYAFSVEPRDVLYLIGGPIAAFGLGIVSAVLRFALGLDEENPQALLDQVREFRGTITALAIVAGIVILGPLMEELMFRGLTFTTVTGYGRSPRTASAVAAVVFALVHLADPELWGLEGMVTLVALLLLGVALGELRIRTGRIGPSIFVHSGFNLTTIVFLLFTDL